MTDAVPYSASELLARVATCDGRDVYGAIQAMVATHGEMLTRLMMRTVLDGLDQDRIAYLEPADTDRPAWDDEIEGSAMRWSPFTDDEIHEGMRTL